MKTTELRLGNFIQDQFGDAIIVDGLDDMDVYSSDCGDIPVHAVQPIPLTEQWLLDFGFVNDSNLHYRWTMGDILIYDIDDNCICISDTWEFGRRKYVHQLQNLYFALTQEELEVKL